MADVSVEFGAKDTGLEQTLKTVQAQLTSLEDEVKSGTLSFDELQQTMRKISQAEKVQEQLQGLASSMGEAGNAASAAEPRFDSLGNEASELGNKVEGAAQQTDGSAGLFDAGFTKIAAAFAVGNIAAKAFEKAIELAFSAARAVVDGFGEALDLGARLNALSQQTGESAGSLLVLETAFKNANVSADQVGTSINKLQNFMTSAGQEGSKQAEAMSKLGISLSDLQGKTPTEQMGVFAKAISSIEDPTQRVAAATEVFGAKLGGKLLPVLNEFPSSLEDARSKVGSLEEVMNENAATFDSFGNSIDAVKGKFAAFAAGILSEVIPEIQSLGTSMEQVDAAGLGQKIGSALTPVLRDLNGLVGEAKMLMDQLSYAEQQAREDTGALGAAYKGTQEALTIFNDALFDAVKFVTPFDESIEGLRQTFNGYKKDQDGAIVGVQALGDAASEAAPEIEEVAERTDRFATSLQDIGVDSSDAFNDINNGAAQFTSLIDEGIISLSDMSGEISGQIKLTNDHVALMGELNVSLGEANELASEQLNKIEEQISAEQRRNEKIAERQEKSLADYQMQIQINEALADGNVPLAKSLEHQRELERLIEKIMRDTGVTRKEAGLLAANLLASKGAAAEAAGGVKPLKSNVEGTAGAALEIATNMETVGQMADEIAQKKMDQGARDLNAEIKAVQAEYKEVMESLGIYVAPNVSLDGMISDLGLVTGGLDNTDTKLEQVKRSLTALSNTPVADITPILDDMGTSNKIKKIGEHLRNNFKGLDVTPYIDREAIGQGVGSTKNTIESALGKFTAVVRLKPEIEQDIEQIKNTLKTEFSDPTELTLDGDESISQARKSAESDFSESIDLKLDGQGSINDAKDFADSTFKESISINLDAIKSIDEIMQDIESQRPKITAEVDQAALNDAVSQMQAEITNEFTGGEGGLGGDGGAGGSGGQGGPGGDANADVTSITNILNGWTSLIETIRDRLPMQALA
jgi:hypothetical protein